MPAARRRVAQAHDLASVVDADGIAVASGERPEVGHRAVLPEEGMPLIADGEGGSDHLIAVVDGLRGRGNGPSQRPEVDHRSVPPEEPATSVIGGGVGSDDMTGVVDVVSHGGGSIQGPEVDHRPVLPEGCSPRAPRDDQAHDLAVVVDVVGIALVAVGRLETGGTRQDRDLITWTDELPVADLGVRCQQHVRREAVVLGDLPERVARDDGVDLQREARRG